MQGLHQIKITITITIYNDIYNVLISLIVTEIREIRIGNRGLYPN